MSSDWNSQTDPVDSRKAADHADWSGFQPSDGSAADRQRRLAAAWFQPLWEVRLGDAVVHGWRFTCPFCGQKRESNGYHETQIRAYRHLLGCEWTDRAGMGPLGDPTI